VEVTIADYKYAPAELKVKPGTTVKWINGEKLTSHSILFLGPDGFESERIFPGESWQRTFERPGSYPYRCGPHPEMKGVVEVAE
jgi:plastocyanin